MKFDAKLIVVFAAVASAGLLTASCSDSSTAAGAGGGGGGMPSSVTCTKDTQLATCRCTVGPQTLNDHVKEVANCDDAPSGAVVCAQLSTGNVADSCYWQVAQCGRGDRDYNSCECKYGDSSLATDPVSACTDPLCCDFGDKCTCTTITGDSLKNTQYDRNCTYYGTGKVVSSCTPDFTGKCVGTFTTVATCKGLNWKG